MIALKVGKYSDLEVPNSKCHIFLASMEYTWLMGASAPKYKYPIQTTQVATFNKDLH